MLLDDAPCRLIAADELRPASDLTRELARRVADDLNVGRFQPQTDVIGVVSGHLGPLQPTLGPTADALGPYSPDDIVDGAMSVRLTLLSATALTDAAA